MKFRFLMIGLSLFGLTLGSYAEKVVTALGVFTLEPISSQNLETGEMTYYNIPASSEKTYRVKEEQDDIPKIIFKKKVSEKIVSEREVYVGKGISRSISEEISFNHKVSVDKNMGGGASAGIDLKVLTASIEGEGSKLFGYSYEQSITRTETVHLSSDCNKYKVVTFHDLREGHVKVSNDKFDFTIIDNIRIEAISLCR